MKPNRTPEVADGSRLVERRAVLMAATLGVLGTAAHGVMGTFGSGLEAARSDSGDLTWLPAWRIRELIGKKDVSPVEVVNHFLARIEEFNPRLKAFKHVDGAGARDQARKAEEAVRRGDTLGALHGIPIAVKEHIAVAGMPVMSLRGSGDPIAKQDDLGVARLRAAGAILVGTNTMMGTSSPGPGQYNWEAEARSPWDLSRQPGWSSSGGAAAAAAGLLPVTIGSDGGGSTRLPGAISGLIGFHPSQGRIPRVGDRPRISLTTTIGPLARDARDAALIMQVMAGPDGRDMLAINYPAPDYLRDLEKGVSGFRFAWTDDYGYGSTYKLPGTDRLVSAVRAAAMGFSKLGAKVEPTKEQWEDFWPALGVTEQIFAGAGSSGPTGASKLNPEQIRGALETRGRNTKRFHDLLSTHDLLLSATAQFTAYKMEEWAAAWTSETKKYPNGTFAPTYTVFTHMFNWLGFPAVSVPCGFIDGLPIGLQIVGLPDREPKILQAAAAFMKAFPRTERPQIS
jgi:amidase/aspartyl-tRNA(Asn)/glutamyl-tRNA(Gln) amidotransferase subunit A